MSLQARFNKPAPAAVVPFSGPRLLSSKAAAEYITHSVDLVREMIASREIPYVPKADGEKRQHVLVDRLDLDR